MSGAGFLLGSDPKAGTLFSSGPSPGGAQKKGTPLVRPRTGAYVSTCGGWTIITGRFPLLVPGFEFSFDVSGSWIYFPSFVDHFAFPIPGRGSADQVELRVDDASPVFPDVMDFWDMGAEFRRIRLKNGPIGTDWFFDMMVGRGPFAPFNASP